MKMTVQYAREQYAHFNALCFGGELPDVPVVLSRATTFLGKFCYRRERRLLGRARNRDFLIRLSAMFDLPETEWQDVIIHEMIHCFIALRGIRDTSSHGTVFREMMARINREYGRNIVVSHKHSDPGSSPRLTRRRTHFVCVSTFPDGRRGVTVCSEAMVRRINSGLPRVYNIVSREWYISDDLYFNRFPHSRLPRIYKAVPEELTARLAAAKPLALPKSSKQTTTYSIVSLLCGAVLTLGSAGRCPAQEPGGQDYRIKETVISAKTPKRLRSYVPFWGTPEPSAWTREDSLVVDNCVASIDTGRVFPNWICWNLDLASTAEDKYKFRRFLRKGERLPAETLLVQVIDECYRWAWRKPYGNTNIVVGPLYSAKESRIPYACFAAVCKKESSRGLMPLGFSSVAFIIPTSPSEGKNLYDYSFSVNFVEYRSGLNLFPKLPPKVQEQVEEMTAYELFCPFREIDESELYLLEPEFEHGDAAENLDVE